MSEQALSYGAAAYLDNAATTPVDPQVAQAMAECLTEQGAFGNPASIQHAFGRQARSKVEAARHQVAQLIGADSSGIVWTSGATESNNLAILGGARYQPGGRHVVTSRTEHKAVLDPCKQLEKEGFKVTYLKPSEEGIVSLEQVLAALTPSTVLVTLMHVNNEIGVIQDVHAIGRACRERGVLFHVDAAQSAGKLPIDVEAGCIDLLSITAHKFHGPKGAGALYVRANPRLGLAPLLLGGGQERGLRSGTLATHQIVGLGKASEIARTQMEKEGARLRVLRDRLWEGLRPLEGAHLNGHATARVPNILNVSFEGVEGESLLAGTPEIAVSTGSACSSAAQEPSYVLRALGRSDALAQSSLRFSLGRFTRDDDIDVAVKVVTREVRRLRDVSPASATLPGGPGVATGEAGNIERGAWIRFHLHIENGRVTDARFRAYGCPHTLAAAEWVCRQVKGRSVTEASSPGFISAPEMAKALEAPAEKLGRLLIVEDALRTCLRAVTRAG
jgi:cysteine desulfurase